MQLNVNETQHSYLMVAIDQVITTLDCMEPSPLQKEFVELKQELMNQYHAQVRE